MPASDFPLHLCRTLFGLSACFHFLFVPLSIGLLLCMNLLQTHHVISKRSSLNDAATFWSRLFFLVWAAGVITGYALRAQVTDIWSHYLQAATPVLNAIFGIEGFIAPFMIGGVVAITWLRKWLPSVVIMLVGWCVMGFILVQALTILSVNAWMQVPSMLTYSAGNWQLESVQQILLSSTSLHKFFHTITASLLCGAFFVFAVAGYFLKTGRNTEMARDSLLVACWTGWMACMATLYSGHASTLGVLKNQPMKFAALEAHWNSRPGAAPLVLLAWPHVGEGHNTYELSVPKLMSLLGAGTIDQSPLGINDLTRQIQNHLQQRQHVPIAHTPTVHIPGVASGLDTVFRSVTQPPPPQVAPWLKLRDALAKQRGEAWQSMSEQEQIQAVVHHAQPPVLLVFILYRIMVLCGVICLLLCTWAFIKRQSLLTGQHTTLLDVLMWATPLPWIAILSGWGLAEIGRQPWTIYEHLPTIRAAQSMPLDTGLTTSLLLLLSGLGVGGVFIHLMRWLIRTGPAPLLNIQSGKRANA